MIEEVKNKWVKALRSGEYEKTVGSLSKINLDGKVGYCCLGVLCKISGLGEFEKTYNEEAQQHGRRSYFGRVDFLPEQVMNWAGLKVQSPMCVDEMTKETISLAGLNDNGRSFQGIADIIEKYWEDL